VFQKEDADLIDDACTRADQALAHSISALDVLHGFALGIIANTHAALALVRNALD
jgi:hypothetical protein